MNPINFEQVNEIMGPPEGMTEEECSDLPVAHVQAQEQEVFISCWEMSEEELQILIQTRKIWVWQFGDHVQPISISAQFPFEEQQDG